MELLAVLAQLARRPLALAVGFVLAVASGLAVVGALPLGPAAQDREQTVVAERRLLVDTPVSVVSDLRDTPEAIGTQAAMLAGFIAGDAQRAEIARRAGVPARLLQIVHADAEPPAPGPLATSVAVATSKPTRPYALTIRVDPAVQIITLDVATPTVASAVAVARAATQTLAALSGRLAPSPQRALIVKPLGPVDTASESSGGRDPLLGLLAAFVAFLLWCGTVVVASGIRRAWGVAATRTAATT